MSTSASAPTVTSLKLVCWCCAITVILTSLPSLVRVSTVLPFIHPQVRQAATKDIDWLRTYGFWLVNTRLISITTDTSGICFTWDHAYRNRTRTERGILYHHCHETAQGL